MKQFIGSIFWDAIMLVLIVAVPFFIIMLLFKGLTPVDSLLIIWDRSVEFIKERPLRFLLFILAYIVLSWFHEKKHCRLIKEWAQNNSYEVIDIKRCLMCGNSFPNFGVNFQVKFNSKLKDEQSTNIAYLLFGYYGGSIKKVNQRG